ncbi:2,3-diketo-5-methylthio-1-phosphopentane phosphatase [Neoconidiobolus thromboides FSU 785]|nr:2,3-diketo-5-methylthio-1-phosphopentane phosphatase [Neoconidiobolus thromboides FSU 785]
MASTKIILTDIEGTTTPIPFVKENLFPYFKNKLPSALIELWDNFEFKKYLQELQLQSMKDVEDKVEGAILIPDLEQDVEKSRNSILKSIEWQMSIDRKQAALKNLQGFIWREGYESGEIKGYCFPDVKQAFERWVKEQVPIYIYSSGSIEAQKLLFKYTEEGDMLKFIDGHFDTITAGSKITKESYLKIARELGLEKDPSTILFLSDNPLELDAALEAGMKVKLLIRPQNYPLSDDTLKKYESVASFDLL